MDQIIDKLSEIEEAATRILEGASNQKKQLDNQQEERIASYDKELDAATAQEVEKIQAKLAERLESELEQLRADASRTLVNLDCYYEQNHDALSTEIYEKIIRK